MIHAKLRRDDLRRNPPILSRFLSRETAHHRAVVVAAAGLAEPALHQRRHEPVRADLPRPTEAWPWNPPRAADTQKCIRAGGKHNDLDDVGLDTYHHTFFEMLGNWSFGDYFKKEAIEWAWELVVERLEIPPKRLYATVYQPGQAEGEPSEFDQEALRSSGREIFRERRARSRRPHRQRQQEGQFLDDGRHRPVRSVLRAARRPHAGRATPRARSSTQATRAASRFGISSSSSSTRTPTAPSRRCPQRHVDTGMGFERVTAIIQGTKNFTDFIGIDFKLRDRRLPPDLRRNRKTERKEIRLDACRNAGSTGDNEQEKIDVAFRVIADHIRTLSFAIADGISPANDGRGYVLRRILRRAVRYGRTLGFHEPFFFKLVDVVARTMGDVFPELRAKQQTITETIRSEEEAFNRTLDKGIALFDDEAAPRRRQDHR